MNGIANERVRIVSTNIDKIFLEYFFIFLFTLYLSFEPEMNYTQRVTSTLLDDWLKSINRLLKSMSTGTYPVYTTHAKKWLKQERIGVAE